MKQYNMNLGKLAIKIYELALYQKFMTHNKIGLNDKNSLR